MRPKYRIYRQPDGRHIIKERFLWFWMVVEHDYGPHYFSTVADAEEAIIKMHADSPLTFVKEVRL